MHKRGKCTWKQDGGQGHRFHASIFIDDKLMQSLISVQASIFNFLVSPSYILL